MYDDLDVIDYLILFASLGVIVYMKYRGPSVDGFLLLFILCLILFFKRRDAGQ